MGLKLAINSSALSLNLVPMILLREIHIYQPSQSLFTFTYVCCFVFICSVVFESLFVALPHSGSQISLVRYSVGCPETGAHWLIVFFLVNFLTSHVFLLHLTVCVLLCGHGLPWWVSTSAMKLLGVLLHPFTIASIYHSFNEIPFNLPTICFVWGFFLTLKEQ